MDRSAQPETGDDLLVRNPKGIGPLTQFFTRHRGEPPTLATHQAKFYDATFIVHALLRPGVVKDPWDTYKKTLEEKGCEYCILAPVKPYSKEDADTVRRVLKSTIGQRYSWPELLLALIDGTIGKVLGQNVILYRRLGDILKFHSVCSKIGNLPDIELKRLPKDAEYFSPDGTWDHKNKSHDWFVKYHSACWFNPREKE